MREGRNEMLNYEALKQQVTETILGYEMMNGFHCAVQPVLLNGKPAGKGYVHIPYGLEVRMEFRNGSWFTVRRPPQDDKQFHALSESRTGSYQVRRVARTAGQVRGKQ